MSPLSGLRRRRIRWGLAAPLGLLALTAPPPQAHSQVVLDGTLGPAGPLSGPNFAVTADKGRQVGSNLFHSFSTFNLAAGESATFSDLASSGPSSVARVLARITGGTPSNIDGTLRCTIPNADFYFVNPAGVVFGPNASLDVQGSFAVTTADVVRLADGGRFDARTPGDSVLTTAAPAAFGFLPASQGRALALSGARTTVPPGRDFNLLGQDVTLSAGAQVISEGGRIQIVAVGSTGAAAVGTDVTVDDSGVLDAPRASGTVSLSETSRVITKGVTAGRAGGSIRVRAGEVLLTDNSPPTAPNRPDPTGLYAGAFEDGSSAGTVRVKADRMTLAGGAFVDASSGTASPAGSIVLDVAELRLTAGSAVIASAFGTANAGHVEVPNASLVRLDGTGTPAGQAGGIRASNDPGGEGAQGGTISIHSTRIEMLAGDNVNLTTNAFGLGGRIDVVADEIILDGTGQRDSDQETGFLAVGGRGGGRGTGGSIHIETRLLDLSHVAKLDATTEGPGDAGEIAVFAEELRIDGAGNTRGTGIFALTRRRRTMPVPGGRGGTIRIGSGERPVGSIVVSDRAGKISTSSGGSGAGGDVEIHANLLRLKDGGRVETNADNVGAGGQIILNLSRLEVDGGLISSIGRGAGASGTITVQAGSARLSNGGSVQASAMGTGVAAGISLQTRGDLRIEDGAFVSALATQSDAGTIELIAGHDLRIVERRVWEEVAEGVPPAQRSPITDANRTRVTAEAAQGTGGNVTLGARRLIYQHKSVTTARALQSTGNGRSAQITLSSPRVVLDASRIDGRVTQSVGASPGAGAGSRPDVPVDIPSSAKFIRSPDTRILSNTVTVPVEVDIAASLTRLPGNLTEAGAKLQQQCGARVGGPVSSFVATGRGGAALTPGGWAADLPVARAYP